MAEQMVIYRNIQGEITRSAMRRWREEIQKIGVVVDEKSKGNILEVTFSNLEDRVTLYLYDQGAIYQLQIDYVRVRKTNSRLVTAVDRMMEMLHLKGEKYFSQHNQLIRTLFLNGLIMDEGVVAEKKLPLDFELRLVRETLMGHIHLALEEYSHSRELGDATAEQAHLERLRSFTEELSRIVEALQSGKFLS